MEFRNKIFLGHNLDWLGQIPDRSVHSVITSPSYLGLRDYGIPPSIWGGSADCEHEWGAEIPSKFASHWETIEWKDGRPQEASQGWKDRVRTSKIVSCGVFCRKCGAWRGCFGQEPEIEMYLEHSLQIYTEIYRILRDDGAFWLNIGDSYWGSGNAAGHTPETVNFGKVTDIYGATKGHTQKKHKVLKSKDQCLIPHRLALSLQGFTIVPSDALWQTADTLKDARESGDWESVKLVEEMLRRWAFASQMVNPAGWILRSTIIWLKGNVQPESVTDRTTNDVEYIFLLAKSNKPQFWTHPVKRGVRKHPKPDHRWEHRRTGTVVSYPPLTNRVLLKRLWKRKNLWRAHDYYFDMEAIKEPQKENSLHRAFSINHLKRRKDEGKKIYAMSSEAQSKAYEKLREAISSGAAIRRNKRAVWSIPTDNFREDHFATFPKQLISPMILAGTSPKVCAECGAPYYRTGAEDWRPTCNCNAESAKAIVFDPFMGAGTVAVAATELGRDFSGIEIGEKYIEMAKRRLKGIMLPLGESIQRYL